MENNQITVKLLENEIEGIGEVKNMRFKQVYADDKAYIYQNEGKDTFEVFKRKKVPVCLDFEKKIFSDTEYKEVYPKSNRFGKDAWCCSTFDKAMEYVKKINE